ncbi:hypothetical protein TNCT_715801 [Trichonephila clavata]|uniref:Uncharacterized protein n=1 Tax=Trichonephila clavata TaxID=2740835 RepID=A0A8X6F9J2_TRICU|nr:hypothetical protein TNCT_715801 [Trichonephila clavata]
MADSRMLEWDNMPVFLQRILLELLQIVLATMQRGTWIMQDGVFNILLSRALQNNSLIEKNACTGITTECVVQLSRVEACDLTAYTEDYNHAIQNYLLEQNPFDSILCSALNLLQDIKCCNVGFKANNSSQLLINFRRT